MNKTQIGGRESKQKAEGRLEGDEKKGVSANRFSSFASEEVESNVERGSADHWLAASDSESMGPSQSDPKQAN